jgi:hypothetical protein
MKMAQVSENQLRNICSKGSLVFEGCFQEQPGTAASRHSPYPSPALLTQRECAALCISAHVSVQEEM